MSNRSYPADFSRPLREVPVATEADVQRMLERLRRRCKVGKVSVNGSVAQRESAEASEVVGSNPTGTVNQSQGSGMVPREAHNLERTGSIPAPATNHGLGSGCTSPTAVDALAPPARPLQWERVSQTAMRTTCGAWTCCKVTLNGRPWYELWRRVAGLERSVCVRGGLATFLRAQEIAQAETDVD